MTGPNLNGKYSICRIEMPEDSDGLNYFTIKWGFDTEAAAVAALNRVSKEESIPLDDLVVIGTLFPADLKAKT